MITIVLFLSLMLNATFFVFAGYKLYQRYTKRIELNTIGNPYWQDKVEYFKMLNKKNDGHVYLVGDSMFDRLNVEACFSSNDISNRGIGYDNVSSLLHRLNETVLNGFPRKVLLYIGGNDLSKDDNVDDIISKTEEIIKIIANSGAELYFISVLPKGEKYISASRGVVDINRDTYNFNGRVKEICIESGCSFIDIAQLFSTEKYYLQPQFTSDEIHLNAKGVSFLAEILEPYVH